MNQKKKIGKRMAAWFMCLVMVLSIVNLPGFATKVYASGYNAGDISGTTGKGTESDPVICDTFTEVKAALQNSYDLYIKLTGMSDKLTGIDYYVLQESKDFDNEAPAIVIPSGTTKHLTVSGNIDYRITELNDKYMQSLIANNGGTLYLNGEGNLNVGFSGYTADKTNAVIYNRSGSVYISDNIQITTTKHNVQNRSLPLFNDGGYMEITGGKFIGSVSRVGGGKAVALRCGTWATKTVIKGGSFSSENTAYSDDNSEFAMEVIGSSPVEISGGYFYKGIISESGKTLNDYIASGKTTYKQGEYWKVSDPKIKEIKINVPALSIGSKFPAPECVSDNSYITSYTWYDNNGNPVADDAKVENKEYKIHVIVYTDNDRFIDWDLCKIYFNNSAGSIYISGDTSDYSYVNTYALFIGENHDFSKYVSNGNGTHKVICTVCGAVQAGHNKDSCSGGTATATAKAKCSKCGKEYGELAANKPGAVPNVSVSYRTHVQSIGWQDYVKDGKSAGTYGMAKRLEGINIKVEGNDKLGVIYTTHCQTYGWLPWSSNGDMNGTEGEAKRLEAIEIKLTGADKDNYDIYYRVHAQSYGWLDWAKNGAPAGTAGYGKRLEAIQIVVKKKGEAAPSSTPPVNEGAVYKDPNGGKTKAFYAKSGDSPIVNNPPTSNTEPVIPGENLSTVAYRTHVQSYGWQGWKFNGQMSGTSGEAKRLEGIEIKLTNKQYQGGITYRTHVQKYGWQDWRNDGVMAGTSGEAKRLEAIEIKLTGEMANQYDVYYRVHAQSYGWLGWAKNGQSSGTAGYGKRLEGIQIVLVKKGDKAPSNTYMGISSVNTKPYIENTEK